MSPQLGRLRLRDRGVIEFRAIKKWKQNAQTNPKESHDSNESKKTAYDTADDGSKIDGARTTDLALRVCGHDGGDVHGGSG
jgi:hypothetical protein